MNYKSFNLGDWIGHISGVIEDESELDGNEMRDLVEFLSGLPRWIPVSERLPEAYQNILVTSEDFHWANEPVRYSVKQKCFGGQVDFVAWMPLPEPYKKGR